MSPCSSPCPAVPRAGGLAPALEGALLQWLLDPEEIDLVALYRSYVSGLVAQLRKHRK